MRTRELNWFDTSTLIQYFGIEVFVDDPKITYLYRGAWKKYAEDGKPFLATTERERELKRKELRKLKFSDVDGSLVKQEIQYGNNATI